MPIGTEFRRAKRAVLASLLLGSAALHAAETTAQVGSGLVPAHVQPVAQIEAVPISPRQRPPAQVQPPRLQPTQNIPARPRPNQPPQPGSQIDSPSDRPGLNFDPNAPIDDLAPPPVPLPPPPSANRALPSQFRLGVTQASASAAPFMMGDFFGNGLANVFGSQTVRFQMHAPGIILAGGPGLATSTLGFEFGTDPFPNDVFTIGVGQDLVNAPDGADTFNIAEPLPPNDALTSPGPGFLFDGGTAVYTDSAGQTTAQAGTYADGELWFIDYSYTQTIGINPNTGEPIRPVPSPGVATRRVKIAENFSPEVRDRAFFNYSFFNDAYGGLGDISRYILGFEKIVVDDLVSVELRLPLAGTYASGQALEQRVNRDFELGNAAVIVKGVLLRTDRLIWSGGLGVAVPLADDTVITSGGQKVIEIKNESVHLLPFLGMLVRCTPKTAAQGYIQVDVATNGDPVFGDLLGGPLPKLGVFNDSTLLHLDLGLNHTFYQNRRARYVNGLIGNAEIHYTGTTQESDFITANGLTYTNLKRNFNVLNATFGTHLLFGDNLVVSPGMSIPLRDGLDEQFDYEALLQVNYIH